MSHGCGDPNNYPPAKPVPNPQPCPRCLDTTEYPCGVCMCCYECHVLPGNVIECPKPEDRLKPGDAP